MTNFLTSQIMLALIIPPEKKLLFKCWNWTRSPQKLLFTTQNVH